MPSPTPTKSCYPPWCTACGSWCTNGAKAATRELPLRRGSCSNTGSLPSIPFPAAGGAFQFYFAQREAVESVIYLYEVARYRDRHDMLRLDATERVSLGMFPERWARYVIKMATGTGKTKVLGLILCWSYFHKLYEVNLPPTGATC